jgi:GT2 family glycosyltransferase
VRAAIMVRTTAIQQAGLLDERFFMYSEELEWQMRLNTYGKVVFLTDPTIMHYEGKSSEQNLARRHINFNRSKLLYAQLRWGGGVATGLRLFLLTTYILQAIIEGAKWLLGHKRALRRQRLVQYRTILRSRL